jgi:hypothetical protein
LGVLLGVLRQIGEGRALAGSLNWFRAVNDNGATTSVTDAAITWANRPSNEELSWLDKFELRQDSVTNALPGSVDPLGNPLSVVGDARSMRILNSLALNHTSCDQRCELSIFWGARYLTDRLGDDDVGGFSNVLAADGRVALGQSLELGAAASVRVGLDGRSLAYSWGPQVSLKPATNTWLLLGYNFTGYRDRDFGFDRFTRSGAYVTMRLKFDELTLDDLRLRRR